MVMLQRKKPLLFNLKPPSLDEPTLQNECQSGKGRWYPEPYTKKKIKLAA